jgi:hypothetical protein
MSVSEPTCNGNCVSYLSDNRTVTVHLPNKVLFAIRMGELVVVLYNWFGMTTKPDECQANVVAFDKAGNPE